MRLLLISNPNHLFSPYCPPYFPLLYRKLIMGKRYTIRRPSTHYDVVTLSLAELAGIQLSKKKAQISMDMTNYACNVLLRTYKKGDISQVKNNLCSLIFQR